MYLPEHPFFVSKDKHAIIKRGKDIIAYDCITYHQDKWPEDNVRDLYCMDCLLPLQIVTTTWGKLLRITCPRCDHVFYSID